MANLYRCGGGKTKLDGTAQASDVLSGKTFYNTTTKQAVTGTLTKGASIKNIYQTNITLTGSWSSTSTETITITPTNNMNISKCVVLVSICATYDINKVNVYRGSTHGAYCYITDATFNANNFILKFQSYFVITIPVNVTVIEFENVKSVQKGLSSNPDISAVNINKSIPFVSSGFQVTMESYIDYDGCYAYLSSSTKLNTAYGAIGTPLWCVVEFN